MDIEARAGCTTGSPRNRRRRPATWIYHGHHFQVSGDDVTEVTALGKRLSALIPVGISYGGRVLTTDEATRAITALERTANVQHPR